MNTRGVVSGIDKLMDDINKRIEGAKKGALAGMIRGAMLIQREAEDNEPLNPVDTGNMRASFIIVASRVGVAEGESPEFSDIGHDGKTIPGAAARAAEAHSSILAEAQAEAESSKGLTVIFGYASAYAAAVHENMEESVNWSRPGSGPKFFESAIERSQDEVVRLIKKGVGKI